MSASPTSSSSNQNLQDDSVYDEDLTATSSSAAYLHHLAASQVDNNIVSSTQHYQQPLKHILAQKYAAESTTTDQTSEHHTQMQNLTHIYAYSPLVTSSSHYDANVLDVSHNHAEVVASTGDPLDPDDSIMNSQSFHDNMMDQLIKHEQAVSAGSVQMVSSTSVSSNVCRSDIMFDCTNETVDSTTNGQQSIGFVSYDSENNKITLEDMVAIQPDSHHHPPHHHHHHHIHPQHPQHPQHHLIMTAHNSSHFLQHESEINEDDANHQDLQTYARLSLDQSQAHVINDLPVLSRARASLPNTYLYIEDIDLGNNICGVFARKTIPKTTQFGPVEGVIIEHNSLDLHHRQSFIIFVTESLILDQSDENQSNWMKFVRSATTFEEQNLVLVAKENITDEGIDFKFYFMTTRPINAKEELKVWYSKDYAEKFNLRVLEPVIVQQFNENDSHPITNTTNNRKRSVNSNNVNADITVTTGGHKLRNKIAKTQQQQQQQQNQQQQLQKPGDELNKQSQSKKNNDKKDDTSTAKYQCETCQKVFPRFYSLRRHQIMHSGEKKYKCPVCGMSFSHVYNRNRHVKRHTKTKKTTNQPMSNNDSVTNTDVNSNINNNNSNNNTNNNDNENCNLEQDKIDFKKPEQPNHSHPQQNQAHQQTNQAHPQQKSQLQQHPIQQPNTSDNQQKLVHKPVLAVAKKSAPVFKTNNQTKTNKPYRCHECYKSFTTDDRLLRHAIVHSSDEDVKPLACQFCQKRFLNNSALSCHLKIHFVPKDQPRRYDCVICKEWFDSTQARKDHVLTHADPITGQFTCPTCLKTFEEFAAVRKHIRAFHSDKQYPCTQCEKVFPRPDKLKLHMLRHSDHREFLCANCGKQFKRKDKLKEHMQRMHAPDREAKIAAKQAAKLAQQQNQQHKKFIPKVSPTDYHRFIYKCHTCLLGFKRRGMLVNHLAKRHPDIPPESVPELNLPILKTTRDYYCQYCDKIYKSSSKRKAHIIKNHPGKSLPLSNRHKGGIPVIPGVPNPTYSETVGSITTHPHYCDWCHKQYASKAKLLQHQRKKHPEQMAIINSNARTRQRSSTVPSSSNSLTTQTPTQNIVASSSTSTLSTSPVTISPGVAATNLITILASSSDLQELLQNNSATNDLLTQAMSELTATTQYKGDTATLIITAPTNDPNWSQVCEEVS